MQLLGSLEFGRIYFLNEDIDNPQLYYIERILYDLGQRQHGSLNSLFEEIIRTLTTQSNPLPTASVTIRFVHTHCLSGWYPEEGEIIRWNANGGKRGQKTT